jgi:thiol-disulfide isomerase/thioredoxin
VHKTALRYFLFVVIAASAFGAGIWVNNTRQAGAPAFSGADAIFALNLPDLQNQMQNLAQWRGKVLVVNFWATWCAPCREEIPVFVKMQQEYAGRGLQFVGISIDQPDKTLEFYTNFKINYPTLIGTFDTVEVSRQAGNQKRVLPFTLILGRNGQIMATESGGLTQQKLEGLIKPLL